MMDDTIVALATPSGEGAIHIIRLSGSQAEQIINQCFKPINTSKWENAGNFTLTLGWFYDGDIKLDQVLVAKMKAPASYTGEDIFEINSHGGMVPARRIIETCIKRGARFADAGEFTKRAFLNGKIDLIQAEAIIDLISSKTELSANLALSQLAGGLSTQINTLRQEILDILSYIEANIDFPEDEVDSLAFNELNNRIITAKENALSILKGSKTGKILREGLSTVIVGMPNVGKSSLLNALLKEERAIVTDIPGTTRDEIHEYVNIGEVLLHLIDTAGVRESEDPIEIIGIERAWKALNIADVILLLIDAAKVKNKGLTKEEITILDEYCQKTIILVNKIEMVPEYNKGINFDSSLLPEASYIIPFSVKEKIGFDILENEIKRRVFEGKTISSTDSLLSNMRQIEAMERCIDSLEKANQAIYAGVPLDLLSIDIRTALEDVSYITGNNVQEDLLNNIFSRFCIGK